MSDALAAMLMAQQQQRQRSDPLDRQRRFAQALMQQGASTAPVQSPLEGIARALQGGVGGFFGGQAERQQKQEAQDQIAGLSKLYNARPEDREAIMGDLSKSGNVELLGPLLAQMLSQKFGDERKTQLGTQKFNAMGGLGSAPTGAPASPGMPSGEGGPVIDIRPLPNQPVAPGSFNNNVGNLRASPAAWEGKGAPQNGFETFATPQQGVNAAFGNLGAYVKQNPNITVAEAIAKWAPPNENDTALYIRQVAEGTGINPGMPLAEVLKDPAVAAQMLDAITRKEKGGLPQGVTADTFMAATGGAPAAQAPVQVAQGSEAPPPRAQQGQQPQIPAMPEISPAAQALEQQAMQAFQGGDMERAVALRQKAQEAQAVYAGERAKVGDTRAYDAAEYDRREGNKPANAEQSKSAAYADRMLEANRIIGQTQGEGASWLRKGAEATGAIGNAVMTDKQQSYNQAKLAFINSVLRAESGALIGADEIKKADLQYFPQPGEGPEIVAQKERARQVAIDGMMRSAGPSYKPTSVIDNPMPTGSQKSATPKMAEPKSKADYDALPSGTQFTAPDGTVRVKP